MDSRLGGYQIGNGRWHLADSAALNLGMDKAALIPGLGFEVQKKIPQSDAVILLAMFGKPGQAAIEALPTADTFEYYANHGAVSLKNGETPVFTAIAKLRKPLREVLGANLKHLLHSLLHRA